MLVILVGGSRKPVTDEGESETFKMLIHRRSDLLVNFDWIKCTGVMFNADWIWAKYDSTINRILHEVLQSCMRGAGFTFSGDIFKIDIVST